MTEIVYKELSYAIIGAAMEVHKILGGGFLESVYESALAYEMELRGINFERQKHLSVSYKDKIMGDYIADLVVENQIILELKAVSAINTAHEAQVHHYLSATGMKLAIILNFGTQSLQQKRIVR